MQSSMVILVQLWPCTQGPCNRHHRGISTLVLLVILVRMAYCSTGPISQSPLCSRNTCNSNLKILHIHTERLTYNSVVYTNPTFHSFALSLELGMLNWSTNLSLLKNARSILSMILVVRIIIPGNRSIWYNNTPTSTLA